MKRYKVVKNQYLLDLEYEVNKNIEGGWKPQGGVQPVAYGSITDLYLQAMVKE